MINKITVKGFKSFKEIDSFPLSAITLLTGINGRGKSTFLQVLLLCKQSIDVSESDCNRFVLNGTCVQLGTFDDVRNVSNSREENIIFSYELDTGEIFEIKLSENPDDDMIANLESPLSSNLNFLQKIHFVAADRVGPQQFYLRDTLPSFLTVGTKGEIVGNVLFHKKSDLVSDQLYIGQEENMSQELIIQTGEWISKILAVDNLKVDIQDVGNGVLILSFQFGNDGKKYKPSNVGFGYTYILPIIVSGLIAKEGEILVIENPEAHLHPKAQSELIKFLSLVAKGGIQIFIESHSEHILNALRVQIANKQSSLKSEDVSILFFENKKENRIRAIQVDEDGGIDTWYKDFFDQTENDLKKILGF